MSLPPSRSMASLLGSVPIPKVTFVLSLGNSIREIVLATLQHERGPISGYPYLIWKLACQHGGTVATYSTSPPNCDLVPPKLSSLVLPLRTVLIQTLAFCNEAKMAASAGI